MNPEPLPPRQRIKVKLADGESRSIQHMMVTSFLHPDGTPMSAQQAKLLSGLREKGFGAEQMTEMQRIIDAEERPV